MCEEVSFSQKTEDFVESIYLFNSPYKWRSLWPALVYCASPGHLHRACLLHPEALVKPFSSDQPQMAEKPQI